MIVTEPKDLNLANVKVNRRYYRLEDVKWLTAPIIRTLADVDVDDEHDVWQKMPGRCDQKVDVYSPVAHFPDHLRQFYTAPRSINNSQCALCAVDSK